MSLLPHHWCHEVSNLGKALMRRLLFGHAKNSNAASDILSRIENIQNELHQLSKTESQIRIENLLLEEYRQLSNTASLVRTEISNTLYFYLIGVTILVAGVVGLLNLYFQFRNVLLFTPYLIEFFLAATFIFLGIVSLSFFQRFRQLIREQFQCIIAVSDLKDFFSEKLEAEGINKELLTILY